MLGIPQQATELKVKNVFKDTKYARISKNQQQTGIDADLPLPSHYHDKRIITDFYSLMKP